MSDIDGAVLIAPPTCSEFSEERRQLEPELAFWSKFASTKAAHVLFYVPL